MGALVLSMHDPMALRMAATKIRAGMVVVFATDTVYGIGTLPTQAATTEIFRIKGRPTDRPLPLLLAEAEQASQYGITMSEAARSLSERWWPGPLTLVVRAATDVASALGSQDGTVGVRVPNHEPLLSLLNLCGGALAVTSANRSGEDPALSAEEAQHALGDQVSLILDGGPSQTPVPSAVVDVTGPELRVLRPGVLSDELLAPVSETRDAGEDE